MRAATTHLVLKFVVVMGSFADKDLLPTNLFLDDNGPISDLSFLSTDPLYANADEMFDNEFASDVSPDVSFISDDSPSLDYFQPDGISEYWDEGPSTLSADAENPGCTSSESQPPARLRARAGAGAGTCASTDYKAPPTVFDLSDPKLKLRPICPMAEFPMLPIAVCSSGNPLDEWGPLNNVLLYNSERGKSIYTPSSLYGSKMQDEVLKSLVTNPAELLACIGSRKLYCCRSHIGIPEGDNLRLSDDTRHGRPVCYSKEETLSC